VLVAHPVQQDVPVHNEWVATLDGYVNADIRPQVSGYMIGQNYKEGTAVRKGQVLFEIDPRPFQAALNSARGQLAQAEAALAKSTLDVERDTPLVAKKAVPKEKLDAEIQAKLATAAAVASAKAAVERAELDIEWTKVTSLVDGVAGIAQVQIGNLVGPNSHLTSVSQVNPIKVYFPVSEQEYLRATRLSGSGGAAESLRQLARADPRQWRAVSARRQDPVDRPPGGFEHGHNPPRRGIPEPGQQTASWSVRARADSDRHQEAGAAGSAERGQGDPGGYQVAIVGPDNKASMRTVKASEKFGTLWVIEEGLQPDDQVVVEGLEKVKDATPVVPKPARTEAKER
jgi:multidrug efflux pump subunit AcrA (membrane-fusion protein)